MKAKENNRIIYWIFFVILLVEIVLSSFIVFGKSIEEIKPVYIVNMTCDLMGLFVILIMNIGILREKKFNKTSIVLLKMLFFLGTNLFVDNCCWRYDSIPEYGVLIKFLNILFYINGIWLSLFFWDYVVAETEAENNKTFFFGLCNRLVCGLDSIIILLNWWFPIYFTVDANGTYQRTAFYPASNIAPLFIMVTTFILVIKQKLPVRDMLLYLSYEIFPLIIIVVEMYIYGLSLIYPVILMSLLLIYCNIFLQRGRKIAEQEKTLGEQGLALMISQIQPHFLYNALTTISNLCRKDPEEAEETTVMFSQYLRMNLDSLKKTEPIPFAMELSHVKMYLSIEQKRFGKMLLTDYDIKCMDFTIPALSIEPIVENSVKHGIREKGEPGTVKISSYDDFDFNYVVIEDDGVGFDVNAPKKDDGRSHIGMNNVIDRLKAMINADVIIESSPGNGCKTTIKIPKNN